MIRVRSRPNGDARPGTNVLWLLVAIIVVLSGVSTVLSIRHAEESDDRVTSRALERIETTASAVDEYLAQRISVLQALASAPVFVQGTPEQHDEYMARVDLETLGFGGGFAVVSLDGQMTAAASFSEPDQVVDVSQRDYYQAVRDARRPFVGKAVLSQPTGFLVVPVAVPVWSLDGQMRSILVGALRLDDSGEPPLLRIIGPDITIVEHGAIAQLRSVAEDPVYRQMTSSIRGVDRDATDLAGESEQLVSHAPVGTGAWLIVADTPRAGAFGGARRQLLQELAIKGLLAMLALSGAVIAARHMDRAARNVARSAALSAAQSRVLEQIALRRPFVEVMESLRRELVPIFPSAGMQERLVDLQRAATDLESNAVATMDPGPAVGSGDLEAYAVAGHLVEIAVEQERSANETLQSERRYRALVEANSAAVWRYVPGTPYSETSQWWPKFTGQTPDDMNGLGWLDAVHPDDRERTQQLWTSSIAAGQPFSGSFRVQSAAGESRHLVMRGVPVPSPDGESVEWIGTYDDVTEERRREEALRISEERQRLALESADLGSWDWDLLTGEVIWSPVVERHVGLAPGTFAGTIEAFRSFIHPDDRDYVSERARRAFELGGPFEAEFRMVRADGAIRWTRNSGSVIRDSSGNPVRLLGIDIDTTEEKARSSERQLFLTSVAHDLKNPLAVLKASTQLLQRRAARGHHIDAEEAKVRLSIIESNASRLARRLDDLSDLSLLEAGFTIDLNLGPVDLVQVATSCIAAARRVAMAHNLRLETEQREIVGSFDAGRIERVLDNLISNAIKYSPDGGEILVRLWSDPVNAYVSVADHGIGVPISDRDAVFEFRKRGSNVGSTPGSGVGLAGAARLIELAGGEITIATHDGPGTTFLVRLPLSPVDEGR